MSGFIDNGRRYLLDRVDWIDCADADLWNDRMRIQIDHRGRVASAGFLQPDMTAYAADLRCFYLRDNASDKLWSVPHEPVRGEPGAFRFSVGVNDVQWSVQRHGIRADIQCVVPRDDVAELWSISLTNQGRRRRDLSLFPYFPLGLQSLLNQRVVYDATLRGVLLDRFEYYVTVSDYHRIKALDNQVVCLCDTVPTAWELSIADFVGDGTLAAPAQLAQDTLASPFHPYETANEPAAAVFQHNLVLAPRESCTIKLLLAPVHDRKQAVRLKRRYLGPNAMERALRATNRFVRQHTPALEIQTPDPAFDAYVNHWQPRRSLMLARTLRHNLAPQGRNVIQDAMGGVYVDPASARHWFARIWAHQHTNGWTPHGMAFADGVSHVPINAIPHKDINAWGPYALYVYIAETGDRSILDERVPFADDTGRDASLYQHLCLGLNWLLRDRTKRGLCRLGQGDWCDPLNMAGMEERGESIWLSEALVFALDAWSVVARFVGDGRRAARYAKEAQTLRERINTLAWDGRWYARGFTDEGEPFGVRACREGKIFLNAQSWAMMCGAADARKTAALIRAVETRLMTPAGPMTLAPAYRGMRETIGKLTQKAPGWNENGSVYCHATTFYAYALFRVGEADRAFDVLRSLLPGGGRNTVERTGQLPLYIPNFYRGEDAGRKAGRSSHAPNTGTAAWYYHTVVTGLFGLQAELDGLRIAPQLPSHWEDVRAVRRWRGAEFAITMRRARRKEAAGVLLNGERLPEALVPPQPPGSKHTVDVLLERTA